MRTRSLTRSPTTPLLKVSAIVAAVLAVLPETAHTTDSNGQLPLWAALGAREQQLAVVPPLVRVRTDFNIKVIICHSALLLLLCTAKQSRGSNP